MSRIAARLWERDASLWTSSGEQEWLGWLDAPDRELQRVDELCSEVAALPAHDTVVVLGMGGSSLAPEVFRRAAGAGHVHVLDTTHPRAVRRLADAIDPARTLFVVSSKSGTTLETRSHFDFFHELAGADGGRFAVVTDPGSELEALAEARGAAAIFHGIPSIGGRYSALSPFGLVPAALAGLDVESLLGGALEAMEACRAPDDRNPGVALGLSLSEGWREGRDKVCVDAPHGLGLWLEQLLAESTGKCGRGLVPVPGETAPGPDRQLHAVPAGTPAELGRQLVLWEVATAVAGHVMELNPFDQPDVQAAKDATAAVLDAGEDPGLSPDGSLEGLLEQGRPGDYVALLAFVDPAREAELEPLAERARATGLAVTVGLGPRYLHSTGQLHKGGPGTGLFALVVDDTRVRLPIPGRPFGFARLVRAQAAGDHASLQARGRRVVRLRLEEEE